MCKYTNPVSDRHIFWTDVGGRILRASLDGRANFMILHTVTVSSSNILYISIDFESRRLYWLSGSSFGSISTEGSDQELLLDIVSVNLQSLLVLNSTTFYSYNSISNQFAILSPWAISENQYRVFEAVTTRDHFTSSILISEEKQPVRGGSYNFGNEQSLCLYIYHGKY